MKSDQRPLILYVIGQLGVGGTERHLSQLVVQLNPKKWRIKVLSLKRGGELENSIRGAGIEVLAPGISQNRFIRLLKVSCFFFKVVAKHRPDVIHFFLPEAYLLGTVVSLCSFRSIRVMSRRSQNKYQQRRPILGKIERYIHRYTHAFTANSQTVKRELIAEGVAANDIALIYNGVKSPDEIDHEIAQGVNKTYRQSQKAVLIVMVANLIPYKGHKVLINALRDLASYEEWQALLIGEDRGVGEQLARHVDESGLTRRIHFLGKIENVFPYLLAADIGVLTSYEEGFSNFIIEAMSSGLPMVVTDVGGNAEAVCDGENGFVVQVGDAKQVAKRVEKLIENKDLRDRFSQANKERATKLFAWANCVAKYEKLYVRLLSTDAKVTINDSVLGD